MSAVERTLARIHARLRFSAPAYLGSAAPAEIHGQEAYRDYLTRLRQAYAEAERGIAEALLDRRAPTDTGTFPMRFAAWNDLSPKYLAGRLRQELIADRDALAALRRALPEFSPEIRILDEFAVQLEDALREADALLAPAKKT
jgi:hypothetical protein